MPANLIFVVILAVWAAYLLQFWIRRRDHVATAKSVDRFSEAMRVLERRRQLPAPMSADQPRSYAVSPARPAHPQVVVKRAVAAVRPAAEAAGSSMRSGAVATSSRAAATSSRAAAGSTRVARAAGASAARAARRTRAMRPATARALLLLTGAALLLTGGALTGFTTLPWWTVLVGLAGFVGCLGLVRASVAREHRRAFSPVRDHTRPTPARPAGRRPQSARSSVATPRRPEGAARRPENATRRPQSAPGRPVSVPRRPVAAGRAGGTAPEVMPVSAAAALAGRSPSLAGRTATRRVVSVFDVQAGAARPVLPPAHARTDEAEVTAPAPGTWQPTPVPPPTYTLKAKAAPRHSARAADTPVADLPFDGHAMAFEEEFEDLPVVLAR